MTLCCLELDILGSFFVLFNSLLFFNLNVWVYRNARCLILKFIFYNSKFDLFPLVLSLRFCAVVEILLNTIRLWAQKWIIRKLFATKRI